MSEVDKAIDQIEGHAALAREQKLRAEIERLRGVLGIIACGGTKYDSAADLIGIARRALERKA